MVCDDVAVAASANRARREAELRAELLTKTELWLNVIDSSIVDETREVLVRRACAILSCSD